VYNGRHATLGPLGAFTDRLRPVVIAAVRCDDDPVDNAVVENVRLTIARLKGHESVLSGPMAEGKLTDVGAQYDVGSGLVTLIDS
jgi:carbonic anhydrase